MKGAVLVLWCQVKGAWCRSPANKQHRGWEAKRKVDEHTRWGGASGLLGAEDLQDNTFAGAQCTGAGIVTQSEAK